MAMQADLLLFNGRIYTMDPAHPRAQALAMAGSRILAVGDDAELRPLLGPGSPAVDLEGQTVIPGLIDAHVHFGWHSWAIHQGEVDLDNVPTKAEAVARVESQSRKVQAGQWIQGAGWNKNVWPDPSFPTAADLDAVTRDHPVALEDKSHHATWVNSRALELAGITASSEDPPGGEIVRVLEDVRWQLEVGHLHGLALSVVGERTRSGSLEIRPVAVVDLEIEHLIGDQTDHHAKNEQGSDHRGCSPGFTL